LLLFILFLASPPSIYTYYRRKQTGSKYLLLIVFRDSVRIVMTIRKKTAGLLN